MERAQAFADKHRLERAYGSYDELINDDDVDARTQDLTEGLRLSARLEAGMVALNRGLVSDPAAPFGGVKQSGIGREGGHEGMLEFLESKYIAVSW